MSTAKAALTENLGVLTFADVKTRLSSALAAVGLSPAIEPGPNTDRTLQGRFKGPLVALEVGGGPGYTAEGAVDVTAVSVLCIGSPGSYESCESLTVLVDRVFVPNRSDYVGDAPEWWGRSWVLWRQRSGGRPALAEYDAPAAGRWHAAGSYLLGVASTT